MRKDPNYRSGIIMMIVILQAIASCRYVLTFVMITTKLSVRFLIGLFFEV